MMNVNRLSDVTRSNIIQYISGVMDNEFEGAEPAVLEEVLAHIARDRENYAETLQNLQGQKLLSETKCSLDVAYLAPQKNIDKSITEAQKDKAREYLFAAFRKFIANPKATPNDVKSAVDNDLHYSVENVEKKPEPAIISPAAPAPIPPSPVLAVSPNPARGGNANGKQNLLPPSLAPALARSSQPDLALYDPPPKGPKEAALSPPPAKASAYSHASLAKSHGAFPEHIDIELKAALLGSPSAKSGLFMNLENGNPCLSTIGIDFKNFFVTVDNKTVKLQLWNTAGEERFRTINSGYLQKSAALIFVCDLTNRETLNTIRSLIEQNSSADKAKIVVATNGSAAKKQVTAQEVSDFGAHYGAKLVLCMNDVSEASVKFLCSEITRSLIKKDDPAPQVLAESPKEKCCIM